MIATAQASDLAHIKPHLSRSVENSFRLTIFLAMIPVVLLGHLLLPDALAIELSALKSYGRIDHIASYVGHRLLSAANLLYGALVFATVVSIQYRDVVLPKLQTRPATRDSGLGDGSRI